MRLDDILRAVARLTAEERQQLRDYLDLVPEKSSGLSPEERTQRLNAAFDEPGEGLSQAELEDMAAAMTRDDDRPMEGILKPHYSTYNPTLANCPYCNGMSKIRSD